MVGIFGASTTSGLVALAGVALMPGGCGGDRHLAAEEDDGGVVDADDTDVGGGEDRGAVACSLDPWPANGQPCAAIDREEGIVCRQCSCTSDCCLECSCGSDLRWVCPDVRMCRDYLDGGTCDAGTVPRCRESCAPDASDGGEIGDGDGALPVCSGVATWDLPAGATGCREAWYHGEQMCPQQAFCGVARRCGAYSSWPFGTCTCPVLGPERDICCGLSIVSPADGTTMTAADDVDVVAEGIQIEVAVQTEACWRLYTTGPVVRRCGDAVPPAPGPSWDAGGRARAVVDLHGVAGCTSVCAEISERDIVYAYDRLDVCVAAP